jgi:hypothetical protein
VYEPYYLAEPPVVRAGRLLLWFGVALIALQALNEAGLTWCVATIEKCKLRSEPGVYPYTFGALALCIGAGMMVLVPIAGAVGKIFAKPAAALDAENFAPTIAEFYGITVQMSCEDAGAPTISVRYGLSNLVVRLSDGVTISGELPRTAAQIVREWISIRGEELQESWRRVQARETLKKIAGPDDK